MSKSLRFCMITTFYPPYSFGGDAVFVQQLSHQLARRGHRVDVIHCVDAYRALGAPEPDTASSPPEPAGVTVHRLHSPAGILSPLATHQTGLPMFKLRRIREILACGFDVIHYHNMSLIGAPGFAHVAPAITLCTLHEYWFVCPTHMLFKFGRQPCTQPWCLPCTVAHRRPPQLWRRLGVLQRAAQRIDVFITASRFSRHKHLEMGFPAPIEVLPYFTARDTTPVAAETTGGLDPYFLFVGRLERVKGLQTLIPVFRRYPAARLLVAGTGSYEAALRRMAEGVPNVVFLGHQSGARLTALYANAVALIVPSVWYEVFGIVIIEAFAQRTPAIVRHMGGMPEIIAESGGGFVYDTESALVSAMDRLRQEPALRAMLGARGYEAVQRRWSADGHIAQYTELIGQVQGRSRQDDARSR